MNWPVVHLDWYVKKRFCSCLTQW